MMKRVLALDPKTYQSHPIHGEMRGWAETNCYVDIWIELLHALGHEPTAALPFTFAIDFEGDQWTFFKFPLLDLYDLYGVDTQELAIWRPLVAHIEEQVSRGRPVLVELDSYHLPDTAGTAYKLAHVKSTVAITEIDHEGQHLGYFHGRGFYHLGGDDYLDVLRLRQPQDPAVLPPYAEFVKVRDAATTDGTELVRKSVGLLKRHLGLVPSTNPFADFKERFQQDLAWLLKADLATFHAYAFATLRQYGACFELAATYLRWLARQGEGAVAAHVGAFSELSEGAKTFQFQLARGMARRKPLDLSPLDDMARRWQSGIAGLRAQYA